ncbi:MAG: hypothetical protein AB1796_13260 [Bacillota bacterium]
MAKCVVCGKKGLFLRVNREGACAKCVSAKEQEKEQKLLKLIADVESETKAAEWGVAPWPYEQLADIYREKKDTRKEVAILERFAAQKYAPGPQAAQLLERLKKAK